MIDFYFLVRRDEIDEDTLTETEEALGRFHFYREVFRETGVHLRGFNLPRQHAMTHYNHCTREFGVSSGHCSSITESRHISAVKKPWRRSNRHNALGQMLLINQRMEKLLSARADFIERGMVFDHRRPLRPQADGVGRDEDIVAPEHDDIDDAEAEDDAIESEVTLPNRSGLFPFKQCFLILQDLSLASGYPPRVEDVAALIGEPNLPIYLRRFIY